MPNHIAQHLTQVHEQIETLCRRYHRDSDSVQLLAVSKTKPAQAIRNAYLAGQHHFGENYLQEALSKQQDLQDLPLCWHYIGAIQSNKTKAIAEHFDWVHSVDRLKIAQRLSDHRQGMPPLNICLQINIDRSTTKAGMLPDEVAEVASNIRALPKLNLRGLMAIPDPQPTLEQQRTAFCKLAALMQQLNQHCQIEMDTLSMGMSTSLEAAIAEGATWVRVGTAIFGKR